MEWLAQLRGQIVGLDTAPLIYFVEENPNYIALVDPFFEALDRREFKVVSSVITLTEVLVYPIRARDTNLAQQYRDILFDQENMSTILVSPQIAELAAQIRATYNSRTPDAIQLATAIESGATFFLTNDDRLLQVQDLQVLVLNQISD